MKDLVWKIGSDKAGESVSMLSQCPPVVFSWVCIIQGRNSPGSRMQDFWLKNIRWQKQHFQLGEWLREVWPYELCTSPEEWIASSTVCLSSSLHTSSFNLFKRIPALKVGLSFQSWEDDSACVSHFMGESDNIMLFCRWCLTVYIYNVLTTWYCNLP